MPTRAVPASADTYHGQAEEILDGNIRVARIAGIDLLIHWSWFLIFGFLTYSLGADDGLYAEMFDWAARERYLIGAISAFLFFASVIAHELSHSLLALRLGIPVKSITIFIFGGVSALEREPDNARHEFWIAFVGPGMSFLLAAVFGVLWFLFAGTSTHIGAITGYLSLINVATGAFNLVPGYPLDGGRVLRSILWGLKRNLLVATRIAARVGTLTAYLLMAAGIFMFFSFGNIIGGIWLIFIGFFLKNASETSYEQLLLDQTLKGVTAGSLMNRTYESVPPDMALQELIDKHLFRTRFVAVMVETNLLGVITASDIKEVPQTEWETRSVYRTMTPREKLHVVQPTTPITEALQIMAEHDIHQVPVIATYDLLGFVTRGDVLRFIEFRANLRPPAQGEREQERGAEAPLS
ncbi:MAG: CBS domain-containing protein [Dehalococcoidia bacterium]|nr:CBS domain-containing protein [Dehalococcoidia bacterium]